MKLVDKKQKSELQQKADTDLLTGLTNKAATIRLIKEYMEHNPNGTGVLFVIDIDNFKKINDTMGHAFGDEVLKELGHQLRSMFRAMDVVGRFGGDEFMVFMSDVKDTAVITRNGDRLREFFRNFKAGEYVKYSVTASIGAAVFSEDGKDFESLFRNADKAVYVVKKRGKNDVVFYGDVKDEAETQLLDYKGREE
jgi:diguanylate cyclase (GGDEF)-like protein